MVNDNVHCLRDVGWGCRKFICDLCLMVFGGADTIHHLQEVGGMTFSPIDVPIIEFGWS
jgi:hypothetical protein